MGFVHRSDIIRPVRDIMNFFVYRKYIKKFDETTKKGRYWLDELRRNVHYMGFNKGVEAFETWYEGTQKVGRDQVHTKLRRQEREAQWEREDLLEDLMLERDIAKQAKRAAKEEEKKKQNVQEYKPYNPEWQPTEENLNELTPKRVDFEYDVFEVRYFEVLEHGQVAIQILYNGQTEKILSSKRFSAILIDVKVVTTELKLKYGIASIPVKKNRDDMEDDFDIDISHVNRAMGNNGSGNSSMNDDFFDNIF